MTNFSSLPYDVTKLKRELKKFYISITETETQEMLNLLGLKSLDELFSHIPCNIKFKTPPDIGPSLEYLENIKHVTALSKKNNLKTSFIGHGLQDYQENSIVPFVSNLRALTTAYTPYQPERSQGTLHSLWLYSQMISELTGFEAINSSMYDRSTCLFEALNTATKLVRGSDTVLVCESIFHGDLEVLKTMEIEHKINIEIVPINAKTGLTNIEDLERMAFSLGKKLAGIAFSQINSLGNLENVDTILDITKKHNVKSIAIIDPALLATGGLKPPSTFGTLKEGADILVGEGQHLALKPNFGGPGLGIFGIRHNAKCKNDIRQTPGRYIGKGVDENGLDSLLIVLSTREQHIRREKATSNICSNQAFIATLAGASILAKGENGMKESLASSLNNCKKAAKGILKCKNITLAFSETPFFNEFTIELPIDPATLIKKAAKSGIHIGVDVGEKIITDRYLLLISFSDKQSDEDINKLINFFIDEFGEDSKDIKIPNIPDNLMREGICDLPNFSMEELKTFYTSLSAQNVSPDDIIYPLGSCTMKYNPFQNDYLASLPGFSETHPEAPESDVQGNLEILYNIQEMFKSLTGLPGVTTQPVAGAQGELTGLKLFQAYHRDRGEGAKRNILLIPKTAHGTNPATATVAGFETNITSGKKQGIVLLDACEKGQIDFVKLKEVVSEYGDRIAGLMVTNPNTSGIFETNFKDISDLIHSVGGLVYMDGANMNAIAGWVDLNKMGVDAVHNNLHKTWSISHGGGGPGDAIVAVSDKLVDYLPGVQVIKDGFIFKTQVSPNSIGSFHRHFGNFAHKVRCYSYLKALGSEGVKQMSAISVLSARYLQKKLETIFPSLPYGAENEIRMHEFIITLSDKLFEKIEASGIPKAQIIGKVGKLFLDYGLHAPTVAFPEIFGLMIEPTESYSKAELDRFAEVIKEIFSLINENPEVLKTTPHFTPVLKINEVGANKNIILKEKVAKLPIVYSNRIMPSELEKMNVQEITKIIIEYSHKRLHNYN